MGQVLAGTRFPLSSDTKRAECDGRVAACNGRPFGTNPYAPGSDLAKHWTLGYKLAAGMPLEPGDVS